MTSGTCIAALHRKELLVSFLHSPFMLDISIMSWQLDDDKGTQGTSNMSGLVFCFCTGRRRGIRIGKWAWIQGRGEVERDSRILRGGLLKEVSGRGIV